MIRISKTKYLGRVARCYQYSTFNQEAIHFEQTVMRRSSVRAFNDTPIPHETFSHILSLTQRTPTGYNLQPWVAVVVNDETKKHELHEAALSQKKILEAPATVVFAANHHVLENLDHILKQQVESGSWDKEYAERTRVLANALLRTDHCQLLQVCDALFTHK
jgi:nitroreductase